MRPSMRQCVGVEVSISKLIQVGNATIYWHSNPKGNKYYHYSFIWSYTLHKNPVYNGKKMKEGNEKKNDKPYLRMRKKQKNKNLHLPIPVPQMLNCDAFIPRPFFATSPKSHPSPYLQKILCYQPKIDGDWYG